MNTHLREKFEGIVGAINEIYELDEQGCTSVVRKIITEEASYLLKSSFKEKYREWLKSEALVLEKLNNKNLIQVPTYYGFIEDTESSHIIMSFETGITLTSALKKAINTGEKKSLYRSFGQFLNQLHEINTIESLNPKNDWLNEQLIKAEHHVKSGKTDGNLQLLEKLQLNKPLPVPQTIIHGDCTTDNVLVVDGEVRLFIDVSGMTVGDPRYDESLAIRNFVNNDEFKKAFYEGYIRYTVSMEEFQYFDQGLYEFF
ncbi:MAG: phosphotransferase family protein [Paenisporosarcina sp.]